MNYVPSSAYYLIIVQGTEVTVIRHGRRTEFIERTESELAERKETHDHSLTSYGHLLVDKETSLLTLLIMITTIR
jgi:hypothetical protein